MKKQRNTHGKEIEKSVQNDAVISGHNSRLPTTFELTQIAAMLSGGSIPRDASKLAQKAFQLWEASYGVLMKWNIHRRADEAALGILLADRMKIIVSGQRGVRGEVPKAWPCSFDEALRLVMPKKRTKADRYVLFRSFLRYAFQVRHSKKANGLKSNAQSEKQLLDEIEASFKGFKQQGFSDLDDYKLFLKPFCGWLDDLETQKISEQRTAAAKARWSEKRDTGGQAQSS